MIFTYCTYVISENDVDFCATLHQKLFTKVPSDSHTFRFRAANEERKKYREKCEITKDWSTLYARLYETLYWENVTDDYIFLITTTNGNNVVSKESSFIQTTQFWIIDCSLAFKHTSIHSASIFNTKNCAPECSTLPYKQFYILFYAFVI